MVGRKSTFNDNRKPFAGKYALSCTSRQSKGFLASVGKINDKLDKT